MHLHFRHSLSHVGVLMAVTMTSTAIAQPVAVDLGTLGGAYSGARDINVHGQVVGSSTTSEGTRHAFSWTPREGLVDLGTPAQHASEAIAVSDAGQVIGWLAIGPGAPPRGFSWTPTHGMMNLGTLGGNETYAAAVNNTGEVVGGSTIAGGREMHAYRWSRDGGMLDLGTLGGEYSRAVDVNDRGQVVGESTFTGAPPAGELHAFLWTEARGMSPLVVFGMNTQVSAINNAGQIVGQSDVPGIGPHAFRWTDGTVLDIGTLGGAMSSASDVNAQGDIAGTSETSFGPLHAFFWSETTGMVDIGTLGGFTSVALDLNDHGQVVGYSTAAGTPYVHAFSWTLSGGLVDLGIAAIGHSTAFAVNRSGIVAGYRDLVPFVNRATIWHLPGIDSDGDGVSDASDNCPNITNAEQQDLDADGLGDPCDATSDVMSALKGILSLAESYRLHHGVLNALAHKLRGIAGAWERGGTKPAFARLGALLNQLRAQSGKGVSEAQLAALAARINALRLAIEAGNAS